MMLKMQNFTLNQCGYSTIEKKSSALLMLSSAKILLARASNLTGNQEIGAVAQLGARLNGIQEVTGSIPVSSTEI